MRTALLVVLLASIALAADAPDVPRVPIRLDPAERQAIGLTWGTVERRPLERTVRAVGRLAYDERRLTDVTLKVGGWVEDLFVDYTGATVARGAPLLTLYSPDLVTAEQEYLLARETAARLAASTVAGAAESADALLRASRERLRLWDLDDAQVRALERTGRVTLAPTIRAPRGGVVVEKAVVRGTRVEPGTVLYRIADLSVVWVFADVRAHGVSGTRSVHSAHETEEHAAVDDGRAAHHASGAGVLRLISLLDPPVGFAYRLELNPLRRRSARRCNGPSRSTRVCP